MESARPPSPPALGHNTPLPPSLVSRVPLEEKLVLAFVLEYLREHHLPAQLLVNGGYVRDLLLGKPPDDLDVSLCLRECPEEVTIETVMSGMGRFARARADLAVSSVQVVTILSDASKNKNVDTAKAIMTVQAAHGAARVEVDFMPTIGAEMYDEHDRVPLRDVRGTPEEDALRRDLTIGAMLLHVTRAPAGGAAALEWRLLDYFGGLSDLRAGVLRSPFPTSLPLPLVYDEVIRTPEEHTLAAALGIHRQPRLGADEAPAEPPRALRRLPAAAEQQVRLGGAVTSAVLHNGRAGEGDDDEALQKLWWAKVLKDDPLRVLRALRFAAKLSFELHDSFWSAAPFSLRALQGKVAGSRKATELVKLAKAGRGPLLQFLELSFSHPFKSAAAPMPCLAPALFGGADYEGKPRFLAVPRGYDAPLMRRAVEALPLELGAEESLGTALAAAVYACRRGWSSEAVPRRVRPEGEGKEAGGEKAGVKEGGGEAGEKTGEEAGEKAEVKAGEKAVEMAGEKAAEVAGGGREAEDRAAREAALAAAQQLRAACDGLCASNELRAAAEAPLQNVAALLAPPAGGAQLEVLAAAAAARGAPVDADEFAALVAMWDVLKLDKVLQGKRSAGCVPHFVVALAAMRCSEETAAVLRRRLDSIHREGAPISGKALIGIPLLQSRQRGEFISQLHVLVRLRGDDVDFGTSKQLVEYLETDCEGALGRLQELWRAQAEPAASARPKRGKKR